MRHALERHLVTSMLIFSRLVSLLTGTAARINSPGHKVAVPDLPTTILAARFAQVIASVAVRPVARVAAMTATTVSPAPDTSNTSHL